MTLILLARPHFGIQRELLPALEKVTGPLRSALDKSFVKVCSRRELARLARREFQTIHGDNRGLDPDEEMEVEVEVKGATKKVWMPLSGAGGG